MMIDDVLLKQIVEDLGLKVPYSRGQQIPVTKCWHFTTDGSSVDAIYSDADDFVAGMNRIHVVGRSYKDVIILAFCLMDTHIHFILYGEFESCNRFIHDYIRQTSRYISLKYHLRKKLLNLPIHHQKIDTDFYLKTVICYVLKNPSVGGLHFTFYDYPWSSGALYFRNGSYWTAPRWTDKNLFGRLGDLGLRAKRQTLKIKNSLNLEEDLRLDNGLIFPGEYVAYELVEKIFKTYKSFHFFMCISKEEDVESRGEFLSRLSIPISELRKYREDVCDELFHTRGLRMLDVRQRVRVAKVLKGRYRCSVRQVARVCGLLYDEVKGVM